MHNGLLTKAKGLLTKVQATTPLTTIHIKNDLQPFTTIYNHLQSLTRQLTMINNDLQHFSDHLQ